MMRRVVRGLKRRVSMAVKRLYFLLAPPQVQCNICSWKDFKLESDAWHPHTICPNCQSQVRQRLFYALIVDHERFNIKHLFAEKEVLHIAPDPCLTVKLRELSGTYITADFLAEGYDYDQIDINLDMSNMHQVSDASIDTILAFDVLEHIPNHINAIKESHRVLKSGGHCVFMVPQQDGRSETYEDLSIIDPKKREAEFGQWDHVRIYGDDFKQMIQEQGFDVVELDKNSVAASDVTKNVLYPPVVSKHPLATNERRVYFGQKR